MMRSAHAVLNAMDEARVMCAIKLVDEGKQPLPIGKTRYQYIKELAVFFGVHPDNIDYWMDEWFKIPK